MMLEPVFIDVFHKSWIINEDLGKIGEKDSLVKYPGEKNQPNKQQTNSSMPSLKDTWVGKEGKKE